MMKFGAAVKANVASTQAWSNVKKASVKQDDEEQLQAEKKSKGK